MIFICDKNSGEIKFFYSGDTSQIEAYPYEADNLAEAIFDDDPAVLERPQDYRVILVSGRALTYAKKPSMTLFFEDEGRELEHWIISGDGDEAILYIKIEDLHPLDELGTTYNKESLSSLQLYINEVLVDVEAEAVEELLFKVPLTSNEPGLNLIIRGNENLYLTNSLTLEVV